MNAPGPPADVARPGSKVAELERHAAKCSREVGTATLLVAVLPLLAVLVAPVIAYFEPHRSAIELGLTAFGFLLLAALFGGLGLAMRRRVAWSFKVSAGVFYASTALGVLAILLGSGGVRVGTYFAVALPLAFAWAAQRADKAVAAHAAAQASARPAT